MAGKEKLSSRFAVKGMRAHVNFLHTGITAAAASVDKIIWLICLYTVFTASFSKDF